MGPRFANTSNIFLLGPTKVVYLQQFQRTDVVWSCVGRGSSSTKIVTFSQHCIVHCIIHYIIDHISSIAFRVSPSDSIFGDIRRLWSRLRRHHKPCLRPSFANFCVLPYPKTIKDIAQTTQIRTSKLTARLSQFDRGKSSGPARLARITSGKYSTS